MYPFLEEKVVIGDRILEKTHKYFSELDNKTIAKLYHLYKVDFAMFNYNYNVGK